MIKNDKSSDAHIAKEEALTGRREAAASIAINPTTRKRNTPYPILERAGKFRFLAITIILLLITGLGAYIYVNLFAGSTYKSETISIIESVQELATLTTAEAVVTTVIKEEDNKLFNKDLNINFPGTKRTTLLVVPATVLAGVDLNSVTAEDIAVDEEGKQIRLTLPHAKLIQEPSIQMDKVQTFSDEGLFRSEVNWDEGFNLAAEAKQVINQEAIDLGLLTKAEDSAVKILSNFFDTLGYKTQIEFN